MAWSRKKWIWLGVGAFVLVLVAGVATAFGVWIHLQQRNAEWLSKAEGYFNEGDWALAKSHYGLYLSQEPKDFDALEKYAQASLNMPESRLDGLQKASIAYNQIINYDSTRKDIKIELLGVYEKLAAWGQLLYFSDLLLAEPPDHRPDDQTLRHYRAKALDGLGRREAAMDAYKELIASGQARAEVYGRLARLLSGRELKQQAAEVWKQGHEALANDPLLHVEHGLYCMERAELTEAAAHLVKAAELAPDDPAVLMAQARLALLNKDWSQAADSARKAIQADPTLSNAYLALAEAQWGNRDQDKAIETLESVPELVQADSPGLFVRKAELQLAKKHLDDAKATLKAYVATYPSHATTADYLRGRLLLAEGDAEAAAKRLVTVVERNPNLAAAEFFLAVARLEIGQRDEARSTLESYLRKNPGDTTARSLQRRISGGRQGVAEASATAASTIENQNASEETIIAAAYGLLEAASREETVAAQSEAIARLFERALDLDPLSRDAYVGLADLQVTLDNYTEARKVVARAVSAGVSEGSLRRVQAAIALAAGDADQARQAYEKYLGDQDVSVADVMSWCTLFERHGHKEAALATLTEAEKVLTKEEDQAYLGAERVALLVRRGGSKEALAALEKMEPLVEGHEAAQRVLNSVKIQMAGRLLTDSPKKGRAEASQLLDEVRASGHEESAFHVVEGRLLLPEDKPDYEAARAAFATAVELDSANLAALSGLAHASLALGETGKALGYIEKAASLAPRNASFQLRRAEILMRMQRFFEAREVLDKVLERDSKNLAAMEMMVNACLALAQLKQAERILEHLESVVGDDPEQARAVQALRGKVMLAKGEGAEAEKLLREQYETNPDDFAMLRNLASTLSKQGRSEEAERLLVKYCEQNNTDPDGFVALARLYLDSKRPENLDKASTALTRALLIDRDHLPALREMVDLQTRRGSAGDVLGICERYLAHDPDNASVLYLKASFLRQESSRQDEALEAIERALKTDERPEYLAVRGLIFLEKGEHAKALQDLQSFSRAVPDTPARIDMALAETYHQMGDLDLAQSFYKSGLKKMREGQQVKSDVLERVEKVLGQEAHAE